MRRLAIAFVAVILTACGGGDEGPGDAGEFSKDNIESMVRGQWARVYDDLHPAHQEIIDRDLYVNCQSALSIPGYDVEVDETYEETIEVPRLGSMETMAVTMELSVGDNSEFLTRHLVEEDGEWKWISTDDALDAYEQGECP